MKVPRISLAKLHGFSHYGDDCPLKILWRSLYKANTYEEFVMLAMLNQEPRAPIDLGTVQSFIYNLIVQEKGIFRKFASKVSK